MAAARETQEIQSVPGQDTTHWLAIAFLRGAAICGLIWILCWIVYQRFPYCRPGADLVRENKEKLETTGPLFSTPDATHVAVFGTSKALAGFIPAVFDRLVSENRAQVESYNLGLPDVVRFLPDLERVTASGQAPQIILLTDPWPLDDRPPTFFRYLDRDREIMKILFPFRGMPRDYLLFALLARSRGGLTAYYNETRASLKQLQRDRGYYFIARQSHYADNRLPDDFREDTDRPDFQERRTTNTRVPGFARFYAILARYRIRCFFVPVYARPGKRAPADPADTAFIEALRPYPLIQVLGPNYLTYPNRLFSDAVHLNPEGAGIYTRAVAELVKPRL